MSHRKARRARQDSRFYKGRTTHTSSEQKKLKKRKEYRRQKLSKQKRLEFLNKMRGSLRWVFGLAMIALLINLVQIKSHQYIGLTGLSEGDKQVITGLTDKYISGANQLKPFFEEAEYEAYILDNAAFVSRVEASTSPFSTSLKVRIVPKTPVHAYRGTDNSSAQWIAQDGSLVVLTEEQILDMGSSTPDTTISDTSGVNYVEGEAVLPVSTLDFIDKITLALALEGVEVSGYEITDGPREINILIVGEKYKLIVSVDRSIESLIIDYQAALTQVVKSKKSITEYIDLRVIDKVFYR